MDEVDLNTPPPASSPDDDAISPSHTSKPARRSRVSLACQRCKRRKQKCNGDQPSCGRCIKLNLECHYVMPINQKPGQAKIYIKALEDRVAELEMLLTRGGDTTVSHDHWNDRPDGSDHTEESDIQPLLNAVRDLSLDVAGSYVGGASTITLGRALESALAGKTTLNLPPGSYDRAYNMGRGSLTVSDVSSLPGVQDVSVSHLDQEQADGMVHAYLGHLYTNFPIMYSYDVLDLHKRRHVLTDVYEESILHLIYGLGGHFLEKTGDTTGAYSPERHYEIALDNREAILRLGDTRSLTYLLLLSQHCLRMPKDPGAWTFVGLAMRMCVELGLHRRRQSSRLSLRSELNKRIFWACYYWDRDISIALGRPPSISDHDIDVELPLDVDEANRSVDALRLASEADKSIPVLPETTMTCYIHLLRLKRIDSDIQHLIYRVDTKISSQDIYRITDVCLDRLLAWKSAIPQQSTQVAPSDRHNFRGDEYHSYDSYMASYHKSVRLLLQPRLYEKQINPRYLEICAESCRGVCETYKRIHYRIPLVFTSVSLQTVFLAGLTLVYCMWHDFSSSNGFKSVGALTDCSIILYVMTEKWPAGRKYRDLFESVKQSVLDAISEEKHIPGTAVPSLKDEMQLNTQGLHVNPDTEGIREDLEQMIGDMTGEQITLWDDVDMTLGGGLEPDFTIPIEGSLSSQAGTLWEVPENGGWFDNPYTDTNHILGS